MASTPPLSTQAADRGMFIAFELLRNIVSSGPGEAEAPSIEAFMEEFQIRRRQALAIFFEQTHGSKIRPFGELGMREAGLPLLHCAPPREWLGDVPPAASECAIELLSQANLAQSPSASSAADAFGMAVSNHNSQTALRCSRHIRNMLASADGLAMLPDVISSMTLALSVREAPHLKDKIFRQTARRILETGPDALPAFIALAPSDWAATATSLLNGSGLPPGGDDRLLALALSFGGRFPALQASLDEILSTSPDSPSQALDMAALFSLLVDSPWSSGSKPAGPSPLIRGGAVSAGELGSCAELLHGWSHAIFRWPSACPDGKAPFFNATMASIFPSWPGILARNEAQHISDALLSADAAPIKTKHRL